MSEVGQRPKSAGDFELSNISADLGAFTLEEEIDLQEDTFGLIGDRATDDKERLEYYSGRRCCTYSQRRICMRCTAAFAGLLLLVVLGVAGFIHFYMVTKVQTTCGNISGIVWPTYDITTYLSIPYAAPPTGESRWLPPAPLHDGNQCNRKTKNGILPGGVCMQTDAEPDYWTSFVLPSPTEDCLTLTIWRPTARGISDSLPVMVFFHGGGLLHGHALSDWSKVSPRSGTLSAPDPMGSRARGPGGQRARGQGGQRALGGTSLPFSHLQSKRSPAPMNVGNSLPDAAACMWRRP
ncbi:hypothetical protein CYMTET_46392 [Cymbomonas tetramitiformis]|uniref:Carboxylesterase type B domain-containing protein n=1 Tax=Cymbomonas tetramitiformis TaxID=36881 RepID=A0AAE0EX42_9CHLO|nr:hypothetical protein CYMTET_46393 [Cymbomonas tetramitiformis]KAK3243981.1 hypothetical protein CYMTET_46392 [Cymbomonas tetramitiformis]